MLEPSVLNSSRLSILNSVGETYVESDQSCVTISGAALQGRHVRLTVQSANSTAANMADTPTRNSINERLIEVDDPVFQ